MQHQLAYGSKELIETSKTAAEAQLAAAKKKFKEAQEAGDFDAAADAQAEIAEATLAAKVAANMRPHEVREEEFQTPPPQQTNRPVLSRRTQAWVEQNSDWWGVDDEMTADRKSTRLNSSHVSESRMPSSA